MSKKRWPGIISWSSLPQYIGKPPLTLTLHSSSVSTWIFLHHPSLAHINKMAHHGKQVHMYHHKEGKSLVPLNNARLFNFFLTGTEAQGRNWTPKLCHEWNRPLQSRNSEEKQWCRKLVERRPLKSEHQVQTDSDSHLVYWVTQSLLFIFLNYSRQHCLTDLNINAVVNSWVTHHWYSLHSLHLPLDPGLETVTKEANILQ